jgi:hypothetical protein
MAIVPQTLVVDHQGIEGIVEMLSQVREALAARVVLALSYAPDQANSSGDAFALLDAQVNQQIEAAASVLKQRSDC